jgi:NlpC/P60 family protein
MYSGPPYADGGATLAGFDCSGFVNHLFGSVGIPLLRTSGSQYAATLPPNGVASKAGAAGDLSFFETWDSANSGEERVVERDRGWVGEVIGPLLRRGPPFVREVGTATRSRLQGGPLYDIPTAGFCRYARSPKISRAPQGEERFRV